MQNLKKFEFQNFANFLGFRGNWPQHNMKKCSDQIEVLYHAAYTINYMQRIGTNQFRWPKVADALLTHKDDILSKVQPPVPMISRGDLGLCAEDLARTRKLFVRP